MGNYYEQPFKLVEHQVFRNIGEYKEYPEADEVTADVEKHFGKKVTIIEQLDRENHNFIFEDGSNVELLVRPEKYCGDTPDILIPAVGQAFRATVSIDWTGGNKPVDYVPQKYSRDYVMVADEYDERNVRVLTIREGEAAPFQVDWDWFQTYVTDREITLI